MFIKCFGIAIALTGFLPSFSCASAFRTVAYTQLAGIPVDQTSIDLYECNHSARALVVYVHGGAWIKGDKGNVHSMPNFFAVNDICYASANYPLQSPDRRLLMEHQIDALSDLNLWLSRRSSSFGSYKNVTILAHSAGAHLVALADKRFAWYSGVDHLILMDSSSYDLGKKFQVASFEFRQLLTKLLQLDGMSPGSRHAVFRRLSPALLTARPSPYNNIELILLSGHRSAAKASAQSLGESYSGVPGYIVRLFEYPWMHRDFPRKIGTDPDFGRQLLQLMRL